MPRFRYVCKQTNRNGIYLTQIYPQPICKRRESKCKPSAYSLPGVLLGDLWMSHDRLSA